MYSPRLHIHPSRHAAEAAKRNKNAIAGIIKGKSTGKGPCQVNDLSKISGHGTEASGIMMHEVKSTLAYSVELLWVALN